MVVCTSHCSLVLFIPPPKQSGKSKSFLCKCSFIEIYNEQIYDLLDSASASLFLRENIKKGVFVEGAVEKFVNSAAEAYQVGRTAVLTAIRSGRLRLQ